MDDDHMELGDTGYIIKEDGLYNPDTDEMIKFPDEEEDDRTERDQEKPEK